MRCLRLTHVNVRVDRLEPALAFYRDALGLAETERGEKDSKGAWLKVGEQEIHLTEDPAPQPPSKRHFALEVDDLAEARRRVVAAGAVIEREEARRFWTRDPSGNRVEIVQAR